MKHYFRSRRSSTSDFTNRRHRESNSAPFFSRSNTATREEYKRLDYRKPSSSTAPYSISRPNTEDSATAHANGDVLQDIEMAIVRTKPHEEDSSLRDLLRISELERQNKQRRHENNDAASESSKQTTKARQSGSDSTVQYGNASTLSDVSKRASELDLMIEIDNGEMSNI